MPSSISISPGLPAVGLPKTPAVPVGLARHGPSSQPGPPDGLPRLRTATPEGTAHRRVPIDTLRHDRRSALSGLPKEAGSAALLAAQQALLEPGSPTTATVGKELWSGGSQGHKSGTKTLGTGAESDMGAGAPAAPLNMASFAFKQHAVEPGAGKTRHADMGKTYHSVMPHGQSQAHVGTWARSVEAVGINALGREGLGLSAAGFGEVGVGARGHTQVVKQHRLGEAAMRGSGELSASAQGSGKVSANLTGLNVQAGGQARAGVKAESGLELRAREAGIDVAGVRLDFTPNAIAKGRTSAGVEGGGSLFAGVSVPTAQERAAGTQFKAGLQASGTAFAGAKAEGDASVGIGGNKVGLTGGLWAGAGAEGKAKGSLTKVNGRTTAQLELKGGAAFGLGGALGINAQVDVQPVVDAVQNIQKLVSAVGQKVLKGSG